MIIDKKKERQKEYSRLYYQENKEKINKKTKKYREKNKEKSKINYKKNRKKILKTAKIQRRTKNGLISAMWYSMNNASKQRKHQPPNFTFKEFKNWTLIINEKKFKKLYNKWKNSNYNTYLRPSVNRLNDYKSYYFKNMELVTWKINQDKGYKSKKCIEARQQAGKKNGKIIYQYTLNGKFIKEFSSSREASKILKIHNTGILKACQRKYTQTNSFLWRFKDKVKSKNDLYIKNLKIIPKTKKVVRFTKDGIFSKEYNSIRKAGIDNNMRESSISDACNKRILTSNGFIWRLKSEVKDKQKIYVNKKKLTIEKPVIQYDINLKFIQKFDSITKASKITGRSYDIISNICHKKQKSSCGFIWRFE